MRPMPGTLNTLSTMSEPVTSTAASGPKTLTIGTAALRIACRQSTVEAPRPFAFAVRM
jgi:hypothetical protein